jgi:hypothetical protein
MYRERENYFTCARSRIYHVHGHSKWTCLNCVLHKRGRGVIRLAKTAPSLFVISISVLHLLHICVCSTTEKGPLTFLFRNFKFYSSFIIVTKLLSGRPGFKSRQGRIFLIAAKSGWALGPTQPPIQCVPELFPQE